ncbi:MAG: dTDP-glucose 4,6-dehydratase [Deltaproteobacteria bacterium]|nr:dTDP-glucose 4,6-dehydratase [Deltaproteobacteria bacterium]
MRKAVRSGLKVVVVDKLTYAADRERLKEVEGKYTFYNADICNKSSIKDIFEQEKPDKVVHFAAESHVDRSILDSDEFITTNVQGTQILLDRAKESGIDKFIHISTDEVYGDIEKGQFYETTPLNPSSPYSASKAAADLLTQAYMRTFNFPAIILRPSNNYGPWQFPEKFIPVIIYKALKNEKIPVYGKGLNIREWLHVSDCVDAVFKIMGKGKIGEIYNIGSGNERTNIDIVKKILDILEKPHSLLNFVQDRPGHDLRYSVSCTKLKEELSWATELDFDRGINETVHWYKENFDWLESMVHYLTGYWQKVYKK